MRSKKNSNLKKNGYLFLTFLAFGFFSGAIIFPFAIIKDFLSWKSVWVMIMMNAFTLAIIGSLASLWRGKLAVALSIVFIGSLWIVWAPLLLFSTARDQILNIPPWVFILYLPVAIFNTSLFYFQPAIADHKKS